jgi:hypothetical protein
MKSLFSGIVIAAVFALAACSDDKGSSSGSTPAADAGTGSTSSAQSCTSKDQQPNDKGIGAYCDTSSDCKDKDKAPICSESNDDGKGSHFCTNVCDKDGDADQCGSDASCECNNLGCGCTPKRCL